MWVARSVSAGAYSLNPLRICSALSSVAIFQKYQYPGLVQVARFSNRITFFLGWSRATARRFPHGPAARPAPRTSLQRIIRHLEPCPSLGPLCTPRDGQRVDQLDLRLFRRPSWSVVSSSPCRPTLAKYSGAGTV